MNDRIARILATPGRRPVATLLVAAAVVIGSLIAVQRLEPSSSLDMLYDRGDAASHALASVLSDFRTVDNLIVLASAEDDAAHSGERSAQRLITFAEDFERALDRIPESRSLIEFVESGPPAEFRTFVEKVMGPAALWYLDAKELDQLQELLSPSGIERQIRQNERMIATPGASGTAALEWIKTDPLALRKILARRAERSQLSSMMNPEDRWYFSPDRRSLMIRVIGVRPATDLDFTKQLMAAVDRALAATDDSGLHVQLTGSYAIAAESERAIRGDMIRSIVGTVIALHVLFLLAYRRLLVIPAVFLPVGAGILAAFGIQSLFNTALNPLTAVIGAILAGLGIDYCIHYLTHWAALRDSGLATEDASQQVVHDVGPSLAAACTTTVLGFAAIALSSVPALRDFAVLGILGLVCTLVAAFGLLPVIGGLLYRERPEAAPLLLRVDPRPLIGLIAMHRKLAIGAGLILATASALVLVSDGRIVPGFTSDLTVMHPRPNRALHAQRELARTFDRAPDPLLVLIESETKRGLLQKTHDVQAQLASDRARDAGLESTYGLADLLPDPRRFDEVRAARASLNADQIVEHFRRAVSESLFDLQTYDGYTAFLKTLLTHEEPPTIDQLQGFRHIAESVLPVSTIVNDEPATRGLVYVFSDTPMSTRDSRDQAVESIRSLVEPIDGATLTGLSVLGYDAEQQIRIDLERLLSTAAVLVLVWLAIYFRSAGALALALLPAGFGLLLLLGYMALFDERINTVNLIAIPLLVGIGVDDGILLVSISRRSGGADTDRSLLDRVSAASFAVLMTSVTTMLAFGSLILTSTPAIQSLGRLSVVGVLGCLLGTVLLVVPLLLRKHGRHATAKPATTSRQQ